MNFSFAVSRAARIFCVFSAFADLTDSVKFSFALRMSFFVSAKADLSDLLSAMTREALTWVSTTPDSLNSLRVTVSFLLFFFVDIFCFPANSCLFSAFSDTPSGPTEECGVRRNTSSTGAIQL